MFKEHNHSTIIIKWCQTRVKWSWTPSHHDDSVIVSETLRVVLQEASTLLSISNTPLTSSCPQTSLNPAFNDCLSELCDYGAKFGLPQTEEVRCLVGIWKNTDLPVCACPLSRTLTLTCADLRTVGASTALHSGDFWKTSGTVPRSVAKVCYYEVIVIIWSAIWIPAGTKSPWEELF